MKFNGGCASISVGALSMNYCVDETAKDIGPPEISIIERANASRIYFKDSKIRIRCAFWRRQGDDAIELLDVAASQCTQLAALLCRRWLPRVVVDHFVYRMRTEVLVWIAEFLRAAVDADREIGHVQMN
ncbi:MAG TPA: hypothetical protein VIY90_09130 [Steroidobacteraceae bacterium]